ncbi:MAG: hypothetical protein QOJ96_467 [Alphaproteobacteria bacterium]|jgi:hypothetical protein|nr:hypothetical protein [Alphaproteobacteria bacterium]
MEVDWRDADALFEKAAERLRAFSHKELPWQREAAFYDPLLRARLIHDFVLMMTSPVPVNPGPSSPGSSSAACPHCGKAVKLTV